MKKALLALLLALPLNAQTVITSSLKGGTVTTADANADNALATSATTKKFFVLQGRPAQTANILEIQKSDGTVLFGVSPAGITGVISGLTANTLPKATSATTIGNSSVTDNGTTLTLGNAGVTVTESTGALGLTQQAVGTVPLAITGIANQTGSLLTLTGGATPGASYSPFMSITGTLPASPSAAVSGTDDAITTAGSAGFSQRGRTLTLNAGYTGTALTAGLYADNKAAGTGTSPVAGVTGNVALLGNAQVSVANGYEIGVYGLAYNDGTSGSAWGVFGQAFYGKTGIGAIGLANNNATANVGGYFGLNAAVPTVTSAGLIVDNAAIAAPISIQRDNGTKVFSIEDQGYLYAAGEAGPGGALTAGRVNWGVPAASPVAYTHTMAASARGGTDTDTAGAGVTITPGLGTGTGTPSIFGIDVPVAGSTGTTQQTTITKFQISHKAVSMPNASATGLVSVSLPTDDTGCAVHLSFTYVATDGTDTVTHAGIAVSAITNINGTVTGSVNDSGEAVNGTGCNAGCDSWTVTASGTTATIKASFNNTLAVTGSLTFSVLNNSCAALTRL